MKYSKKKRKQLHAIPCKNFENIIKKTKKKNIYAIFPIKNKISGIIEETNKILKKNNFFFIDKIKISINHCLISKKKQSLKTIKVIYSHSQPIKQCELFINKFSHWKIKYTNSSSDAIKIVSNNKENNIAAIGNEICSKLNNMNIIKKNISNCHDNKTLFYILSKNKKI
ncbi:prephenate dehydratase domain-containing protein [Buchnera aphidicola]|uniref:prephenate dehydratase domain-containing protein n=1 Tax=Buchnera aphidicola TaxID=9 RepID=UPI0031B8A84E